jgi:DNA-binding CsgD family transcriptional regulator
MRGVLTLRADWVGVVEAAYAEHSDDGVWGRAVLDAVRKVMTGGELGLEIFEYDGEGAIRNRAVALHPFAYEPHLTSPDNPTLAMPPAIFRAFYFPRTMVITHGDVDPTLAAEDRGFARAFRKNAGFEDALGVVVHPAPGVCGVLYGGSDRRVVLESKERAVLSRIGIHLETAYRLRHRPEALVAVLRPDGKVEHRASGQEDTAGLTAQVRRIEQARSRATRADATALHLWSALVAGQVSLVERGDGASRRYLVVENAPRKQPIRALNPGELQVLALSARGMHGKLVAYALGISASTVSTRLGSAAEKVGLLTRTELVRLAAILAHDPRAPFDDGVLTTAEREIIELLARGLSNREIAITRNRSVRTVANQVASLLQKTASPSRRALAARMAGVRPTPGRPA